MVYLLILLFLFATPTLAQLEPDETGCQTWDNAALPDSEGDWFFRAINPDSVDDNTGVWTEDAHEGLEIAWIEMDFGRKYVLKSVSIEVDIGIIDHTMDDLLEIRSPDDQPIIRWQPLEQYILDPPAYVTFQWTGSHVADSIGIYFQMPTDLYFRGVINEVTLCVEQQIDLSNSAFVMKEFLFTPLVYLVGIITVFALVMLLVNALYGVFR